jgi:hypothetical protein
MCPACIATAAWIAGGTASAGGLALLVRRWGRRIVQAFAGSVSG